MGNEFTGGHNVGDLFRDFEARLLAIEQHLGLKPIPQGPSPEDLARLEQLKKDLSDLQMKVMSVG